MPKTKFHLHFSARPKIDLLNLVFDVETTFHRLSVGDFEFIVAVELQHIWSRCVGRRVLCVYCVAAEFIHAHLFRCDCTWDHQIVFARFCRFVRRFAWNNTFHQAILVESFCFSFHRRQMEAVKRKPTEHIIEVLSWLASVDYALLYFRVVKSSA